MLQESPQKRPNIYQAVRETCHMRGKDVPIRDVRIPQAVNSNSGIDGSQIYSNRSTSEARRYQQLPPSPTEPQVGAVFAQPVQQETKVIPEVAPMRRGRPGKPTHSHHSSARPSPSPFRGPSADPFAALDGGAKSRDSTDDIANRFPSLDQFHILHEKGEKFDFEPTVADSKQEDEDLSRRLTNALADDAFVKRPSPERASASEPTANKRPQVAPLKRKPEISAIHREGPSRQAPLHQPSPQKPGMVSTGTMTSPSPLPEPKPSSRPIFKFPVSDDRRPPSEQMVADNEKRPQGKAPSPPDLPPRLDLRPSMSTDRLSSLSVSARPSMEATRPSNLDVDDPVVGRSKSANSKIRPVSVHAMSQFESPRGSESARSSLELSRPYAGGADDYERANINSDVDYLRAKEEEVSRKREKRSSGASKHVKRSSLTTLSLSGTKTLFGGRFGDAFRRFESTNQSSRPQSPSVEETPKQPMTVTASEVTEPDDPEDDSDISPEMRRELERRRLSQEEKRVANAAADYRRRVAEKGDGGRAGAEGSRSRGIQNRVQTLFGDANKQSPQTTASGYGRYTETETVQAKQTEVRTEQKVNIRPVSQSAAAFEPPTKGNWESPASPGVGVVRQQTTPIGYTPPQRDARPAAPPKPKNLRVGVPETRPDSQGAPGSAGSDWEASFSRRFPSLAGLEMVETEIEVPKVASVRTREV
jgi:AP2-associated kinase